MLDHAEKNLGKKIVRRKNKFFQQIIFLTNFFADDKKNILVKKKILAKKNCRNFLFGDFLFFVDISILIKFGEKIKFINFFWRNFNQVK